MPDAPEPTIRLSDWRAILAGIKQFGIAPDGSDLRDLAAACERLEAARADERERVAIKIRVLLLASGYRTLAEAIYRAIRDAGE